MNIPIMRRGLSPEGRQIREKHQSSLLNDEFGVTCQPIHKKIEKDYLKENVMRLKEIQAKCRTQESRPSSGCQPFKAIRPTNVDLALHELNPKQKEEEKYSLKLRDGSAHSDYFSLSDDVPTDCLQTPNVNNLKSDFLKTTDDLPSVTRNGEENSSYLCNRPFSPNSSINNHLTSSIKMPMLNSSPLSSPFRESNASAQLCNSPTNSLSKRSVLLNESYPHPKRTEAKSRFGDFYTQSSSLGRTKLGDIIGKIKSKKPACDINIDVVWKDITNHHKILFHNDDRSTLNTPRAAEFVHQRERLTDTSKGSNCDNRSNSRSTIARSQSLDRNYPYQASLRGSLHSTTRTMVPRPKSTARLIDLEPNLRITSIPVVEQALTKEDSISCSRNRSDSSLNLSTSRKDLTNHCMPKISFRDSTATQEPNLLVSTGTKTYSCPEGPFHIKDRPDSNEGLITESCSKNTSDLVMPQLSSESEGTSEVVERSLNFSPVKTNCDPSNQSTKEQAPAKRRGCLLRSKSSSNLQAELPPSYKLGQIPKYLKSRKEEAQRRLEAAAAIDPSCPPGHAPLPDHERRNTLHLLKKGAADVMQQLSTLPLAQDTLRVRKVRQELETKLSQIEEGIAIFSQSKVYIVNDE